MGNDGKGAPPLYFRREGRLSRGALGGAKGHVHGGVDVAVPAVAIKPGQATVGLIPFTDR
jgi:hypothetical protein